MKFIYITVTWLVLWCGVENTGAQTKATCGWKQTILTMVQKDSVPADSIIAYLKQLQLPVSNVVGDSEKIQAKSLSAASSIDNAVQPTSFEQRFAQVIHMPVSKLDSIEESGYSNSSKDAQFKAMTILEEESSSKISFVYGYAYRNRDFSFYMPKAMNDLRLILTKKGLNAAEDKRNVIIRLLYIADTFANRVVTHAEFVEMAKYIAAMASDLIDTTDTLHYERVAVPSDDIVREMMHDQKSKIELLPGGFKTTYLQKMLIERRISEVCPDTSQVREDYENMLRRLSTGFDLNHDRILTEDEVRSGVMKLKTCPH
jgi:hypothetical protein